MKTATAQLIATLPTEWHEAFLERSAIREYDGQMPREKADAEALTEIHSAMVLHRLASRVAELEKHQREHAKPVPLTIPKHAPIIDRKLMAAGEIE